MYSTSNYLEEVLASAYPRLLAISEEQAGAKPHPDKWSFKEIVGHLIDSASNNQQRLVRMQELPHIGTFRYSQEHWVGSQQYGSEPWADLVELWFRYNRHLVHVIACVNPATLEHLCDVGDPRPVTLRWIIEDYVRHVEHHLRQIMPEAGARP